MPDETNKCPSCADHPRGKALPGSTANVLVREYVPPTAAELELSRTFYAAMGARGGRSPFTEGAPVQTQDASPGLGGVALRDGMTLPNISGLPMDPQGPSALSVHNARTQAQPTQDAAAPDLIRRAMSGEDMLMPSQLTAPWFDLSHRADRLNPAHEARLPYGTFSLKYLTAIADIHGYLPTPFFPPWLDPDQVKDYWRLFAKALFRRRPITAKWVDRKLNVAYEGLGTFLCEDIQAIQIIKRTFRGNRDPVGLIPDDYPATKEGWVVDHNDMAASPLGWNCSKGQGCSPYYGDHVPGGWKRSKDGTMYTLLDAPYSLAGRTDEFEVCFVCIVGGTFHSWLGCIAGMKQETDMFGNVIRTDGSPTAAPSGEFLEALENFNEYYNGGRSGAPGAPREATPVEE